MKKTFLFIFFVFLYLHGFSQEGQRMVNKDSVLIENKVEFFIYDGPYGQKQNVKEPAIRFILTIKNLGTKPIPDIDVTNRSKYVNLYINDSISNPVSMYNGTEEKGPHLLKKNESDSYTWWLFEKDAYSKSYTVQWQYQELLSKKVKVNMIKKTTTRVE